MRLVGMKCLGTSRLHKSSQVCLVIKRFKKHFTSLQSQEKKLFVFPNTLLDQLSLPAGIQVSKRVDDFKIKTLKGGFQRRPELLVNSSALLPCDLDETWNELSLMGRCNGRFDKNKRIQEELVEKAVSLICNIEIKAGNNIDVDKLSKDKESKLVLDIGCGNGSSTRPLLAMGYSCVGIDLNLHGLTEFQEFYLQRWKNFFHDQDKVYDFEGMIAQSCKCYDIPNFSISSSMSVDCKKKATDEIGLCTRCGFSQYPFKVKYRFPGFADVVRWDLRYGLPFRSGTFDMVVSISFLQWLFYGDRQRQLCLFFSSVKSLLQPQGKAVIQFYPRSASQLTDTINYAMKHFQGVLVGDYPHVDRGRKLFLVLFS